jgi:hypothetical protein
MTRLWLAFVLFIPAFVSIAQADQQQTQAVEFIRNWVAQVKGEAPLPEINSELPPIKCGTPAFVALAGYNHLNSETKAPLQNDRPSQLPDSYGTSHFIIHYTTTGPDSVYGSGIDSIPGIPLYVTRVSDVFEHVWSIEIDSLGYQHPPADFGNGGDSRYDVYLTNLGFGFYGFTAPESTMLRNGVFVASSFIEIENDFAESPVYRTHPLDAVKVTAAHEFFHSIQLSYDEFEEEIGDPHNPATYKPWWPEASSTWMETVVYNSIKDYLSYLPYFYRYMWMGLGAFSAGGGAEAFHPYASCVWPIYMTTRFGDLDLMRQIWQICGQVAGYNTFSATNTVLGNHGSNISSAFLEFETWNFQTGSRADTINTYIDGRRFPSADTTLYIADLRTLSPYSIPQVSHPPQQFATNYIIINSPGAIGGVIANFNGQNMPSDQGWHVALFGFRTNDSRWADIQVNSSTGDGAGAWPEWNLYREVVLVPTVSGLTPNASTFNYTGILTYDPTLTGSDGVPGFGVSQAYPSPYLISSGNLLTIPYSLDDFYSKTDLKMFIYDASGGLVREIPGEYFLFTDPGSYYRGIQWDGKNSGGDFVASGIYIILFKAGSNTATGKIVVVNSTVR